MTCIHKNRTFYFKLEGYAGLFANSIKRITAMSICCSVQKFRSSVKFRHDHVFNTRSVKEHMQLFSYASTSTIFQIWLFYFITFFILILSGSTYYHKSVKRNLQNKNKMLYLFFIIFL